MGCACDLTKVRAGCINIISKGFPMASSKGPYLLQRDLNYTCPPILEVVYNGVMRVRIRGPY